MTYLTNRPIIILIFVHVKKLRMVGSNFRLSDLSFEDVRSTKKLNLTIHNYCPPQKNTHRNLRKN